MTVMLMVEGVLVITFVLVGAAVVVEVMVLSLAVDVLVEKTGVALVKGLVVVLFAAGVMLVVVPNMVAVFVLDMVP